MNKTLSSEELRVTGAHTNNSTFACELMNVSLDYKLGKSSIRALSNLSMKVASGEFGVIMGPSGSGKSSLLNLMGCVDRPTTGEVKILGEQSTKLSERALTRLRRDKIGFIFQNFSLIPVLSAAENVEYPLILSKIPAAKRREMVADALASVGLANRASHKPGELSGGQRQRVAIARALVKRPELVIADEPTANVDSKTAAGLMQMIKEIQAETGSTFFVATHDPAILDYATARWTMADGSVTKSEEF